jgi:hypothetical protein
MSEREPISSREVAQMLSRYSQMLRAHEAVARLGSRKCGVRLDFG